MANGPEPGSDRGAAIEQYRAAAPGYDPHMRRYTRWQRVAIERLELRPGDVVIDVACGTGLNFPLLEDAIGPTGGIIGIDLSPEMLGQASRRVADNGWDNVADRGVDPGCAARRRRRCGALLVRARRPADARCRRERRCPLAARRPRGNVGAKLAGGWSPIVNFFVRRTARPYITTFRGLDRPWRELERHTAGMQHRSLALGGAYIAWGQVTGLN